MLVIVGQPCVFQVLFVDEQNLPLAVTDASISIYTFSGSDGAKIIRVVSATMSSVTGDVGRYTYVYNTSPLSAGDVLYGLSTGTNPNTGAKLLLENVVSVVATASSSGSSGRGLISQFVKGG